MSYRILVAEPEYYSTEALKILGTMGEVQWVSDPATKLIDICEPFDVIVVRLAHRIPVEVIAKASRLKVIGTSTTGLDHIDTDEAAARQISIVSLKGEAEFLQRIHASSEHTIALLLALIRKLPTSFDAVKAGKWEQAPFQGIELYERTVGLIGFGRIGKVVTDILKGFGARVLAYDPQVSDDVIRERGAEPVTLDALLAQSSVVSLHAPLEKETERMIGREMFAKMQPGALFINTARGQLVDEEALLAALLSGQVGGAAIDVLANEGDRNQIVSDPLVTYAQAHDNLIITSHIAGTTKESCDKTQVFIAQKIVKLLASTS